MITEHQPHPGVVLKRQFLDPLGIGPDDLARSLGVACPAVADLLAGKTILDADMALRLGLFFDAPARWWLEMQARYDAENPEQLEALRAVVTPYDRLADVLVTPAGVVLLEHSAEQHGPWLVHVTDALVAQLRAQSEQSPPRRNREPDVVILEDGTLTLTGR
ncbi:MAG: HigA family addiction module antitoxin [Ardenticatenales bacterium]